MISADFNYTLPEDLIASYPLAERDAARMLQLSPCGTLQHRCIRDLHQLVHPGDLWVINDTQVIPARLLGSKPTGGQVELLLIEPAGNDNTWFAWGKSNKPLKTGDSIHIAEGFYVEIISRAGKQLHIRLIAADIGMAIEQHGHMPLPPYINRPDNSEDKARYQTVFADKPGAIAAPTAGLHLTRPLMQQMQNAGATFAHITLHVGPGTFQPVQVNNIHDHTMHTEAYHIPKESADAINLAKKEGRRIVAVGTTSIRTLEAAVKTGVVQAGHGRTDIFIYPGYQFQVIDALLTNFHLPKSTLLMLVSALAGHEAVMAAYECAKKECYRFYSYGDAMFLVNQKTP
ncbi:MAG: tRNA preQ1(34) S-adenosylmethionine ribosyltransferase-isomerase QueA [Mariprofundaceae bacterium]